MGLRGFRVRLNRVCPEKTFGTVKAPSRNVPRPVSTFISGDFRRSTPASATTHYAIAFETGQFKPLLFVIPLMKRVK